VYIQKSFGSQEYYVPLLKSSTVQINGADVRKIFSEYERVVCESRIFYALLKKFCAVPKNCARTKKLLDSNFSRQLKNCAPLQKNCADVQIIICVFQNLRRSTKYCPSERSACFQKMMLMSRKLSAPSKKFWAPQKNCARLDKIEPYQKICDRVRKNCALVQNSLSTSQNIVCPSVEFFWQVNNFFRDVQYFVKISTIFWEGYKILCTSVRLFGQAENFCMSAQNWRDALIFWEERRIFGRGTNFFGLPHNFLDRRPIFFSRRE
jgi:hypothetical protein